MELIDFWKGERVYGIYEQTLTKIVLIGSGPIVIGHQLEFLLCGKQQACLSLKEEGYEVNSHNSNPASIMRIKGLLDRGLHETS